MELALPRGQWMKGWVKCPSLDFSVQPLGALCLCGELIRSQN
jgi:hypothetical protein